MNKMNNKNFRVMNCPKLSACFFTFLGLAVLPATVRSAPMPGAASSALVSPQLGLYRSPLGFQISAGESGWVHAEPPTDNKFIATLYRAPTNTATPGNAKSAKPPTSNDASTGASLTVRIDELKKEVPLDKYVQRWVKEYPKYGFDVIGSQPFAQNKQKGYVLDLINRDSGKQLRQAVFLKKQKAVILTCRDQASTFKESLKSCNQIIRTFFWEG